MGHSVQSRSSMSASPIARPLVEGPLPRPGLDVHGGPWRPGRRGENPAAGSWRVERGDFHVAGPSPLGSVGQPPALRLRQHCRQPVAFGSPGLERVARDVGAAGSTGSRCRKSSPGGRRLRTGRRRGYRPGSHRLGLSRGALRDPWSSVCRGAEGILCARRPCAISSCPSRK